MQRKEGTGGGRGKEEEEETSKFVGKESKGEESVDLVKKGEARGRKFGWRRETEEAKPKDKKEEDKQQ